jgi:hypothetical protein
MLLALCCWPNHPHACCIYPRMVHSGHQRYHAAPAPPLSTSVVRCGGAVEHSLLCSAKDRSTLGCSNQWRKKQIRLWKELEGIWPVFVPLTGSSHLHEFCGAMAGFRYGQERLEIANQHAWTVTSFCLVPFMSLYVSPFFSSLLSFISSLPQLAWDKRLCCCCMAGFVWEGEGT